MMKIVLAVIVIIGLWSITPLASSNPYLVVDTYTNVCVKSGDTVWNIAAKHVQAGNDIRDLTQAIQQLNGLNNNTQIFPGQILKIPTKVNEGRL